MRYSVGDKLRHHKCGYSKCLYLGKTFVVVDVVDPDGYFNDEGACFDEETVELVTEGE